MAILNLAIKKKSWTAVMLSCWPYADWVKVDTTDGLVKSFDKTNQTAL